MTLTKTENNMETIIITKIDELKEERAKWERWADTYKKCEYQIQILQDLLYEYRLEQHKKATE